MWVDWSDGTIEGIMSISYALRSRCGLDVVWRDNSNSNIRSSQEIVDWRRAHSQGKMTVRVGAAQTFIRPLKHDRFNTRID